MEYQKDGEHMMISLDFPEEQLINALRRLSPTKLRQVIAALQTEPTTQAIRLVPVSSLNLRKLNGLLALGGDALLDSERLYDEDFCH